MKRVMNNKGKGYGNVIAVLDNNTNTVDVITVPEGVLAEYDGIDDYLSLHCGYDPDYIEWMDCVMSVDHYTDEDFED